MSYSISLSMIIVARASFVVELASINPTTTFEWCWSSWWNYSLERYVVLAVGHKCWSIHFDFEAINISCSGGCFVNELSEFDQTLNLIKAMHEIIFFLGMTTQRDILLPTKLQISSLQYTFQYISVSWDFVFKWSTQQRNNIFASAFSNWHKMFTHFKILAMPRPP